MSSSTEIKKYKAIGMEDGEEKTISLVAGPVIVNDRNEILLSQGPDDEFWSVPGGSVKDDETIQSAVIREAEEEAGVEIELEGAPVIFTFNRDVNGVKREYVLFHYRARVIGNSNVQPKDPEMKAQYFQLSSLPLNLAQNIVPVLKELKLVP